MKIITIAVILLNVILFAGIAYSQQDVKVKKTPEEIAQKRADNMKKNLSLTNEQYKKVYDLFLNKAQERKANKEKYKDLDKSSRKELKKQNREKFQSQLKELLNNEQIEKWNQMKSEYKGKRGKRHHKKENKSEDKIDRTKDL